MSEIIMYRGREITIHPDECPSNPREWGSLGTMCCWHGRYNLGDEQPPCDPEEYLNGLARAASAEYDEACDRLEEIDNRLGTCGPEYRHTAMLERAEAFVAKLKEQALNQYVILPLYLYDHSGITMNTSGFSCQWDSGQVGFIYCSLDDAQYNWHGVDLSLGWDATVYPGFDGELTTTLRKRVEACLQSEVEVYDQYLRGDVYGYEVGGESCWGYFGSDHEKSGLLHDARAVVDYLINKERDQRCSRVKDWVKHSVPLNAREREDARSSRIKLGQVKGELK